ETPPQAVVGAFNAGIVSYFSGRPTVNLDGAMNASAIDAVRERRLGEYIRASGITHLADVESQIQGDLDAFAGEPDWRAWYAPVFAQEAPYRGGQQWLRVVVLERRRTPDGSGVPV